MQQAINSTKLLINNLEFLPSQLNRYIKDVSIPLYNKKIIERIDKLETHIHTEETMICPICRDDIKTGMLVTDTICRHIIHHHCIIKLTLSSLNNIICPVCRHDILKIELENQIESQLLFKPNQHIKDIHLKLLFLFNSLKLLGNNTEIYQTIPFINNKNS